MSDIRYIIITTEHAKQLASLARFSVDENLRAIGERLEQDTGADIEDVVKQLAAMRVCFVCVNEGMERDCNVHWAKKLGRRLRRLLERARGERPPGPGQDDDA